MYYAYYVYTHFCAVYMLFLQKQTQYNSGPSVDQLWELDIDKRKWALLQTSVASNNESNSPGPRSSHTIFHYKGDLYVFGGMNRHNRMNIQNQFDNKLYRLKNVATSVKKGGRYWEVVKINSIKPPGREEHAGVLYKDKYYIMGGKYGNKQTSNDLWVLNMNNFKWKALKSASQERHLHQMWAANDKLYVLGGRSKDYRREVNGRMDFSEYTTYIGCFEHSCLCYLLLHAMVHIIHYKFSLS